MTTDKTKLSTREQKEQDIAFDKDNDLITRMMEVLEYRGYVDTDWRSENTFEEDVRPLFEKMLSQSPAPAVVEIKSFIRRGYCRNCDTENSKMYPYCRGCGAKIIWK